MRRLGFYLGLFLLLATALALALDIFEWQVEELGFHLRSLGGLWSIWDRHGTLVPWLEDSFAAPLVNAPAVPVLGLLALLLLWFCRRRRVRRFY